MTGAQLRKFWIVSSGKGLLSPGKRLGFIEATSPEAAEDALIRSGQISEKSRGLFNFEETT